LVAEPSGCTPLVVVASLASWPGLGIAPFVDEHTPVVRQHSAALQIGAVLPLGRSSVVRLLTGSNSIQLELGGWEVTGH